MSSPAISRVYDAGQSWRVWLEAREGMYVSIVEDNKLDFPLSHHMAVPPWATTPLPYFDQNNMPPHASNDDEIPVIDLANPDTSLLIDELFQACSTWGFFQLINHGI